MGCLAQLLVHLSEWSSSFRFVTLSFSSVLTSVD